MAGGQFPNRDDRHVAIVDAARRVFSEQGIGAPVSVIVERAGIGMSGFYRRFPTKDALIETLALEHLELQVAGWEKALAAEDPWEGFVEAIISNARSMQESPALAAALRDPMYSLPQFSEAVQDRDRKFTLVMQRAKDTGSLRSDLEMHDVRRVFEAIRQLQVRSDERYANGWERMLAIVLDGLRSRPGLSNLDPVEIVVSDDRVARLDISRPR